MKSKISFFNAGLFKSTLRRFWPLWVIHFAGWLLFMPVLTLMNSLGPNKSSDFLFSVSDGAVFASPIIAFIMAIISAMAVFGFMYNSRSTGLISSLPVRREAIFCSAWLGGAFVVVSSNLVIALLTFLFSLGATESTALALKAVCIWLGVYSMQFILFYGMASLTAVMTGSIVVLPLLYIIFNFFAIGMEAIIRLDFSCLIWGMPSYSFDSVLDFLSPLFYMVGKFVPNVEYDFVETYGPMMACECISVTYGYWLQTVIYCAAGLIFSAAALMVFRDRRMESAGDVVAVRCMRPVFKYGVTLCTALCGGLLLYTMLFSLFQSRSASVFIMILSMIIFAFIGYFGAKMLLEKSFHVFRGGWAGLIIVCFMCAVFTLGCDIDVFGIGRYVPNTEDVDCMVVYSIGEIRDKQAITDYSELHKKILAEKDRYENTNYDTDFLLFKYVLKDGRTVTREYEIPVDDDNCTEYYALMNSPAVLLERFKPSIPMTVENCASATLWSDDGREFELTPEQAVDFYENALISDIKAGRKIISSDYTDHVATMSITLEGPPNAYGNGNYQDLSIELNLGCTECLAWLKDNIGFEPTFLTEGEYEDLVE